MRRKTDDIEYEKYFHQKNSKDEDTCNYCKGSGSVDGDRCPACEGQGVDPGWDEDES